MGHLEVDNDKELTRILARQPWKFIDFDLWIQRKKVPIVQSKQVINNRKL